MAPETIRPGVWISAAVTLAAVLAVAAYFEFRDSNEPPDSLSSAVSADPSPDAAAVAGKGAPEVGEWARHLPEPEPYIENLVWGEIDLREAQAVMPDNLYWKWGAPTSDPAILEERENEKKRRNEEYGRVLAGDANEAEVIAYFDYRNRLSSDYLEFAQWMRNRYDEGLSEQFRGLLDLSIKLHRARLAEIPREREAAIQRSTERARIREEWRREQEEFAGLDR